MRRAWRLLARHRGYRLLLTAELVSLAGDWVLSIGLTYQVYRLTDSTLASGTMLLAWWLPQTLLGSPAGVLADRWDHRLTMVAADLLLAAGLLPLLLVHDAGQVWLVYLVVFWEGSVEQFFGPAQAAAVPHLVDAEELTAANGIYGQAQAVARLTGSAIGGVIAAHGGLAAVAVADGASFLLSAGLIARVRGYGTPPARTSARDRRETRAEWIAGIALARRPPDRPGRPARGSDHRRLHDSTASPGRQRSPGPRIRRIRHRIGRDHHARHRHWRRAGIRHRHHPGPRHPGSRLQRNRALPHRWPASSSRT
jgi:MFS family permease